jgi:hypothetical protein
MKKIIVFSICSVISLICGCSSDSPTSNEETPTGNYVKIHTAESNGNRFEVWSSTASNFLYGYNNIGIKVFLLGTEQNTGFAKFLPTMYHGIGGSHSIPVDEKFYYDTQNSLFTGYAVFTMYNDSATWAADFNYNGTVNVDSSVFQLSPESRSQLIMWNNSITQRTYVLTLINPRAPRVGLNAVDLMLHETADMQSYNEIESAEMFIKPWMESMGHGSGNNVNPANNGGGKYRGTANFTMPGQWFLYDSIKVNSSFITGTPPPKFILEVN